MSEKSEKSKTQKNSWNNDEYKHEKIVLVCPKCKNRTLEEIPGIHVWRCGVCAFVVDEDKIDKKPRQYKYRQIKVGGQCEIPD